MLIAARSNDHRRAGNVLNQMCNINKMFKRGGIGKAPVNPTVRGWEKTEKSRTEWEPEDFVRALANAQMIDANNQVRLSAAGVPVLLSRDTILDQNELVGRHLDEEAKRCLELLFARFGQPNDTMIKQAIGHLRISGKKNWEQQLQWAYNFQRGAQRQTVAHVYQAMNMLDESTGGPDVWNEATDQQRWHVVSRIFDQAQEHIITKALPYESRAADVETIFASNEEVCLR